MTGTVWNLTLFGTVAILSFLLTSLLLVFIILVEGWGSLRFSSGSGQRELRRWLAPALPACSVHHHRGHHSLHVWPLRLTRPCCRSSVHSVLRPPLVVWPLAWLSSPPWSSWASPPCAGSGSAAPPAAASLWLPGPRLLQQNRSFSRGGDLVFISTAVKSAL